MLRFPNPSRNFDDSKKRVCFWGYDSAIEVSFFIDTVTLKQLCPEMIDAESGVLLTFDAQREQIHEMASKVYTRRSHGSYSHNLSIHDRRRGLLSLASSQIEVDLHDQLSRIIDSAHERSVLD